MSEKEMTLAETRGVVEPDGVREIRELVGKAGRWTQYTIDVLLDYIDTLTAALAEARREREAWKERYLKEAANHDTTRSAWGKEEANMIREARELFAEVERLRAMRKSVSELCNAKAQAAYNRYESECCGRGGTDCCGMPVQRWSDSDEEIMAFADSVLRALAGP